MTSNNTTPGDPATAADMINAAMVTRDPERIAFTINQVLTANGQGAAKLSGWMVSEALQFLEQLGLTVTVEPLRR